METKYNTNFKKNLKTKISRLETSDDYRQVYKIVKDHCTINSNGAYFDINKLPDKVITKLDLYLMQHN